MAIEMIKIVYFLTIKGLTYQLVYLHSESKHKMPILPLYYSLLSEIISLLTPSEFIKL